MNKKKELKENCLERTKKMLIKTMTKCREKLWISFYRQTVELGFNEPFFEMFDGKFQNLVLVVFFFEEHTVFAVHNISEHF
jgi:hypothetical protein